MKGIIEILQSAVVGGGGKSGKFHCDTTTILLLPLPPPPLVINYDRSLNQDFDLPLICSDNCSWPWSRILSPCFSFSSVLHLPALRDPFGIRTCFSSLIKHLKLTWRSQKTETQQNKKRKLFRMRRSNKIARCIAGFRSLIYGPNKNLSAGSISEE